MWFLLKPVELSFRTSRSKERVIHSLTDMASFNGDDFKFPVNYFGNSLFIKSKLVRGEGTVTTDQDLTRIYVTLKPAAQLKVAAFVFTLIAVMLILASFIMLFSEIEIFASMGLIVSGLLFLSVPRIMFVISVQIRKESIENLIF